VHGFEKGLRLGQMKGASNLAKHFAQEDIISIKSEGHVSKEYAVTSPFGLDTVTAQIPTVSCIDMVRLCYSTCINSQTLRRFSFRFRYVGNVLYERLAAKEST
jgi:hypothetical protein